ncbi:Succinate-semialdehyde dehydrogenase (acetylating) [uncultured Flavonifractor sp.]|nr:Succinate-semialdehyde dehydrogenase (acetylating) [uncultured Flavonifractor sp.]
MLALFTYDTWEECMEIARANLEMEGMGHSVVIHSNNTEHIEAVPTVVNVSRYAVNQVGGTALGGAMDNGLNPTTTLGCGTWGNNAISENLWFTHLMNVSRISYKVPDMYIPTDEEIWAD